MSNLTGKIDVKKINKAEMFVGEKGTYLDVVIFMNDEPDQYGNDGVVIQSISKEKREAGEKGPILGNVKVMRPKQEEPVGQPQPVLVEDDIPF